jgi:hypothetical protein
MGEQLPEPTLSALVHLLAEQALLALGVAHPQLEHQPPANPPVGRFYVELLEVLKTKTEGQRTDAETQMLEETLYQLRMRAMNLMPTAPAAKPRT